MSVLLPPLQISTAVSAEIGFWGRAVLESPSCLYATLQMGFHPNQNDFQELRTVINPFRQALLAQQVGFEEIPPRLKVTKDDKGFQSNIREIADCLRAIPLHPYTEAAMVIAFGGDLRFAETKDVLAKVRAITKCPNPFHVLVAPLVSVFFLLGGEMASAALIYQNLGDAWMRAGLEEKARQAYHKEAAGYLRGAREYLKEVEVMEERGACLQAYWLAVRWLKQLELAKEAYRREESKEDLKRVTRLIQEAQRRVEHLRMRATFLEIRSDV